MPMVEHGLLVLFMRYFNVGSVFYVVSLITKKD